MEVTTVYSKEIIEQISEVDLQINTVIGSYESRYKICRSIDEEIKILKQMKEDTLLNSLYELKADIIRLAAPVYIVKR